MTVDDDHAAQVKQLADELTAARLRGLGNLSEAPSVLTPLLDDLARRHAVGAGGRVPQIENLIRDALDAYGEDGKRPTQAAFVRSLFFDPRGVSAIGAGAAGRLLSAARTRLDLAEDPFRRLQRAHFEGFANYLLGFATSHGGGSGTGAGTTVERVPVRERRRPRTAVLVALVVGVLAVVGVVIGLAVSRTPGRPHAAGGSSSRPEPTISITSAPPALVMFRFDDLGSTVQGATYMHVYAGPGTTAADRTANGTYLNHERVRALCITTGRTVASDPHYNETPKTTNLWVRIAATSGETQYATLTYGELIPATAKLPRCTNVS